MSCFIQSVLPKEAPPDLLCSGRHFALAKFLGQAEKGKVLHYFLFGDGSHLIE